MPCDLARIVPIAQRHGLPLIEDAACAIGSEILLGRRVGEDRQAARRRRLLLVPSAQGRSPPATAACSPRADADWDRQFRLLRQHGMSVPDTVRHGSAQVVFESLSDGRLTTTG